MLSSSSSPMKLCKQHHLLSKFLHHSSSSSSSSSSLDCIPILSNIPSLKPKPKTLNLTQQQIIKINLLIPRLCLSNQIPTALNLITTSLSTNPPPKAISFSILIHSLTSLPNLTLSMSLLNKLKQTPPHFLNDVTLLMIVSFLKKGRPREALKVYNWMTRPGSVCVVGPGVYEVLVTWFCRNGFSLEALMVLKDMVGNGLLVGDKMRVDVFRCLLREARVVEAKKLDEGLRCLSGGYRERLLEMLDRLVADWTE